MIDETTNGVIVRLLAAATERGGVASADEMDAFISREFDDRPFVDDVVQRMRNEGLIDRTLQDFRITDAGRKFLDAEATESGVEHETTESEEVAGGTEVESQLKKPYDVSKLKVESRPVTVFQALRKIEKDEIKLDPDFQRAFVWDLERQSRLIESILIRIPLPAFYIDATSPERWEVVDGLQRLTTLHRYCRGTSFQLSGLEFLTELNGSTFHELPKHYQILIEDDTTLNFFNLQPGTPTKAKFTIFRRVNTGGLTLNAQEIRHALVQGPITKLLKKLARSEVFLSATENAVETVRMTDRELVIRSLAFATYGYEDYARFRDLDPFLVDAMEKLNALDESRLDKIGTTFLESVAKVRTIFGRYSFRKFYEPGGRRSPFNKALFEVWSVCVIPYGMNLLAEKHNEIVSGFLELMTSPTGVFVRSITYGTGKASAVRERFTAIQQLLERVCK